MDLNKKMEEISNKVINEQFEAIATKQMVETLTAICKEVYSGYSEFGKNLRNVIAEKSNVSLERIKLVDYSNLIVNQIENILLESQMQCIEPIRENIKKIVGFLDIKEIKLSEFIDKYKNDASQDSTEEYGEITCIIDKDNNYGWTNIYLDYEANTPAHKCSLQFTIYKDGKILSFKYKDYFVNGKSYDLDVFTRVSDTDKYLLRLINSNVKFIVDTNYIDNEWSKDRG